MRQCVCDIQSSKGLRLKIYIWYISLLMTKIVVPGIPIPMMRARLTRQGLAYSVQGHLKRDILRWFHEDHCRTCLEADEGPISICLIFHMPVPKSTSKKALKTINGSPHHCKPDLDNLVKWILDVFNQVLWKDDSLIYDIRARKVYTVEDPRTEIEIGSNIV